MPGPAFTARTFSEIAQTQPWNALFFADQILFAVAENASGAFSSVDRAAALAELAIRFFLSCDDRFRPLLENGIGKECLRNFLDRCALCTQGKAKIDALQRQLSGTANADVAKQLCFRFHRLLSADGVIPVFEDSERKGFLLPFSFLPSIPSGGAPMVFDADDNPIEAWSAAMHHLPEPVGANIRIDAHLGAETDWSPPIGSSLLLPVLAAWWRKEGKLPSYDPLRLLFTGSFRGGAVECVNTEVKTDKVASCVKNGILVHPVPSNVSLGETQIREGMSSKEVFDRIRLQAEEVVDAPPKYVMDRLADYESEVRQDRIGNWSVILKRLEHLRANLNPDLDEDAWLTTLLLTSEANCHAGQTTEAALWNKKVIEFAQNSPQFENRILQALVDQLVILQDSEEFDGILALLPDLDARIERKIGGRVSPNAVPESASDSALDLAMRFHGTMGQFHAYAAISGIRHDLCSSQSARHHLETAFVCAKWLHKRAETNEKKDERAKDVSQDANYLLLHAALFDRSSLEPSLQRALTLAERCGNAKDKNLVYPLRYHALGLYRATLRGETVEDSELAHHQAFLDNPEGNGWILATTAKYLGAVLAGSAKPKSEYANQARRLFTIACEALPVSSSEVLRKIAMTVRAEAYRSLRTLFPKEAADFLEQAREMMLKGIPDRNNLWKTWLQSPNSNIAPFPGLSYWY